MIRRDMLGKSSQGYRKIQFVVDEACVAPVFGMAQEIEVIRDVQATIVTIEIIVVAPIRLEPPAPHRDLSSQRDLLFAGRIPAYEPKERLPTRGDQLERHSTNISANHIPSTFVLSCRTVSEKEPQPHSPITPRRNVGHYAGLSQEPLIRAMTTRSLYCPSLNTWAFSVPSTTKPNFR